MEDEAAGEGIDARRFSIRCATDNGDGSEVLFPVVGGVPGAEEEPVLVYVGGSSALKVRADSSEVDCIVSLLDRDVSGCFPFFSSECMTDEVEERGNSGLFASFSRFPNFIALASCSMARN